MQVARSVSELQAAVRVARRARKTVGCVPTMGALHDGHRSLVAASVEQCDFTVVTIFVNPSQFAPTEDLDQYPRTFEADCQLCTVAGADLIYAPEVASLYPEGFSTWVTVEGVSATLEGASRPTHFRGVTTIVLKLLNLVQPDVAFFGAKDYQQQTLIRRMVRDLDVPVEIVVCPTVREADGLAMSSRNRYLSPEERRSALVLSQCLALIESRLQGGSTDISKIEAECLTQLAATPSVIPDYVQLCDPDTLVHLDCPQPRIVALIAARVGNTRLIDNRVIVGQP